MGPFGTKALLLGPTMVRGSPELARGWRTSTTLQHCCEPPVVLETEKPGDKYSESQSKGWILFRRLEMGSSD